MINAMMVQYLDLRLGLLRGMPEKYQVTEGRTTGCGAMTGNAFEPCDERSMIKIRGQHLCIPFT